MLSHLPFGSSQQAVAISIGHSFMPSWMNLRDLKSRVNEAIEFLQDINRGSGQHLYCDTATVTQLRRESQDN